MRKHIAWIAATFVLVGLAGDASARRSSRFLPVETIGPGMTSSSGPIAFTSEFYNVASFASPHSGPGGPRGLISFLPGGIAEFHFPALRAPIRVKCEVGSQLTYRVVQNLSGNTTLDKQIASGPLPGWTTLYLIIDIADLRSPPPQDVTISITPAGLLTPTWNLTGCDILPRP